MASLSATKVCKFSFFAILFLTTVATVSVSAVEFYVGGNRGWVKPTGTETETYEEWANQNRFHVGDSLYFKYQNDSVLMVNYKDYKNCDVSNPISKFNDGETVYRFDRYGFFYFISGEPGHCKSGQRLDIRVMVHPRIEPTGSAPSPGSGSGGAGGGTGGGAAAAPATPNSTVKLAVGSYFKSAIGGMIVFFYCLFM
ncbi:early nodulin-like protein 2 [Macadamia integrifolia]|uniref:early nodulin-like protein 2 n=1 Tax=Macadamia integrifolia TaxID=60698 RepID=UPI001C4F87BD|nr:early nodulin-like protein 2 [Macadamia integrifolia]